MPTRKELGEDVDRLNLPPKTKRIIQCFLEIECEPSCDRSPAQARSLRKKIIEEIQMAIANPLYYDGHKDDPVEPIPLWHKLWISGRDPGRKGEMRQLLYSLGRQLITSDNRRKPYWLQ